ncbi:MAG TPA: gas vesicle protein [Patescibacteria group bacterium]|nr:gas vesicle protein [Patescibacteria group bacterium]
MPRRNRKNKSEDRRQKKSEKKNDQDNKEGSSKIAKAAHSIVMDLADLLKSVLNSGLVAIGDINIRIEDVELPIKLRLLVTMIEKAEQEGINWWRTDKFYTSGNPENNNKNRKQNKRSSRRKK